jgi:predicted Zn-dependent protease
MGQTSVARRGFIAGVAGLAVGCVTNPDTGREQFIILDDAQLNQLALQAWAQQVRATPVWHDRAAQTRLARVGGRIAAAADRASLQWEYALFDRPDKNAFVLPGGKVGFYRGLLEICELDDHIACVLGHETGHVVGRHAAERYSREIAQQSALRLAGAATDSQIALAALGLGAQVGLSLPFSREQESEADRLGVNFMHEAGYDVRQAIAFWRRMAAESRTSRPPQFLSTHPDPASRIEALRAYLNARGWGPV